ncbi:MAG: hypothetical protein K0R28_6074 [Paenibacillus sp.]|nr:hypothetical protein [Paenibacillus sp.]
MDAVALPNLRPPVAGVALDQLDRHVAVPSATLQRAVAFAEAILRPWRRNRYRDTDPDVRIETPEFFYHRIEHRHRFPEQSRHPIFITRLEKVVDAEKDAYVVDRVVPAALHISYKVEITIEQKRTFRLADVIGHLPSARPSWWFNPVPFVPRSVIPPGSAANSRSSSAV